MGWEARAVLGLRLDWGLSSQSFPAFPLHVFFVHFVVGAAEQLGLWRFWWKEAIVAPRVSVGGLAEGSAGGGWYRSRAGDAADSPPPPSPGLE